MHDIKAIPTVYNGRQYRSRLEARWAAFFDLLGWKYEYEPFDLPGWIPDFLLTDAKVLVEVKPATSRPDVVVAEIDACKEADGYEILIVGCVMPIPGQSGVDSCEGAPIGWMRGTPMDWNVSMPKRWDLGLVQRFSLETPKWVSDPHDPELGGEVFEHRDIGFGLYHSQDHILHADPGYVPKRHELTLFACNRFHWASDRMGFCTGGPGHPHIVSLWSRAGNLTQWRGKQSVVQS